MSDYRTALSPQTAVAVSNGTNNDLVTDGYFARLTGATGAFSVTGIYHGVDGARMILLNKTGQAMTLSNMSPSSLTTNKVYTGTGADIIVSNIVEMIYDTAEGLWQVLCYN